MFDFNNFSEYFVNNIKEKNFNENNITTSILYMFVANDKIHYYYLHIHSQYNFL